MTPFNNELQVGQPAMVINVEYAKNSHIIGTTIVVDSLISPEDASEMFDSGGHAYASYVRNDGAERFIRQKFLMPLPPLDDDVLEITFDLGYDEAQIQ